MSIENPSGNKPAKAEERGEDGVDSSWVDLAESGSTAPANSEVPAETVPALDPERQAEQAAQDTAELTAVRERLGIPPIENVAEPVAEAVKEDPLAGFTPETYTEKFRYLQKGVDFPDLGSRSSSEMLQGKTAGEWFEMTQEHVAESDRVRDALYDKAIEGTITPDQKSILANYLIDHYVIQDGKDPRNGKTSAGFGPRFEKLWESPAFAEVIAIAKEESRKPGRTPLGPRGR